MRGPGLFDILGILYTPEQIAAFSLGGARERRCVVVDQLRATSTIVTALAHGARAVFAVSGVEEARRLRRHKPESLLAGEREGVPPDGFDLGNSPREFTPAAVAGREIVLTTTNGTLALAACRGAAAIFAASFLNLSAVAGEIAGGKEPVSFLCAGTGPAFSLEDAIVVGALVERLEPGHPAASIYRSVQGDLAPVLRRTENGRRLVALGLGEDIAWSLQIDRFPVLPRGSVIELKISGMKAGLSPRFGLLSRR